MKNRLTFCAMTAVLAIVGCIVSDELTTITIRPDGSADWVQYRSNVHSSETGEKRVQELLKYTGEFESRTGPDFVRIADAGGEVLEARWVLPEEPYSTLIKAKFPTASSLVKFCTIKGEKGEVLAQPIFTRELNRCRLSLTIPRSRDENRDFKLPPTFREFREQQANSIAETRIVVTGGQIVASEGVVVSGDKRSCLLDPARIEELLRNTAGELKLFIEWEVTDK